LLFVSVEHLPLILTASALVKDGGSDIPRANFLNIVNTAGSRQL
jgi:hypothetical protein